jgi:large subunit ribosomal protein L3
MTKHLIVFSLQIGKSTDTADMPEFIFVKVQMKALLGTKIGMTRMLTEDGAAIPVTLVQAGPCVITQVKTAIRDGYFAVQIGFGEAKNQAKPQVGHLKASGMNARHLTEVRLDKINATTANASRNAEQAVSDLEMKVGDSLNVSAFEVGDEVQVRGTSKGKGFAGTIKRHNFKRGPKSHGSNNYREPGSIGAMYPEHVFKGMRMAGHMGHEQVSVSGLRIMAVDAKNNILAIRGAVPGPKRGVVLVRG